MGPVESERAAGSQRGNGWIVQDPLMGPPTTKVQVRQRKGAPEPEAVTPVDVAGSPGLQIESENFSKPDRLSHAEFLIHRRTRDSGAAQCVFSCRAERRAADHARFRLCVIMSFIG